ncbi:hypothetical protein AB0H03_03090, partial [Streptomyces sparsogenes]
GTDMIRRSPQGAALHDRVIRFIESAYACARAFALGGALPLDAAVESPGSQAEGSDSAVSPVGASTEVEDAVGVLERTRRDLGLMDVAASQGTPSPSFTRSQTLSELSGNVPDPLIQPILAATRLLRAVTSTPPAPSPTEMVGPSQSASRTPPYHGVAAPPE